MNQIYNLEVDEVYKVSGTSSKGLTDKEVSLKQEAFGKNILVEGEKKGIVRIFLEQFKDVLVIILLIAATISFFMGDIENLVVISVVIVLNAILGTTQYLKAQKSLSELKSLIAPITRVKRDEKIIEIPSENLVPGDIILLEAGDMVAADGRIISNYSLKVNESALTGEAEGINKESRVIKEETIALGDQKNMVFAGSMVTYGRAEVVVTAIGMQTETGKIAGLMNKTEQGQTPLQVSIDAYSKKLAFLILFICTIIFLLSLYRKTPFIEALVLAVALAVAAIPEALSSIVTIVLAMGTQKLAKEKAIIKELKAAESLGSVSIICSDKTGTLTQNKMTVQHFYREDCIVDAKALNKNNITDEYILKACVLCNDSITLDKEEMGDPTEIALVNIAEYYNIDELKTREEIKREAEIPFDSDRKLMSTLHYIDSKYILFTKGATDVLLERINTIGRCGRIEDIKEKDKERINKVNQEFSNEGLRVLGFAYKVLEEYKEITLQDEYGYTFLGLVSMMDPPREETKFAVEECMRAGIKPIMITGDYKTTAVSIAKKVGIFSEEDESVDGIELEQISEDELDKRLDKISVYARVSPVHKIKIVEAWQRKGHIVAMTGDGVNDAPALRKADIGIAMGITGTEVSKQAADMILADDNFATIIKAISNGRKLFKNITNAIFFLLSGNLAGIMCVLYAVILNLPSPFAAVQLLFMNLITDSLPAIAIGLENNTANVMNEPPRNSKASFFNKDFIVKLLAESTCIFIATIIAFNVGTQISEDMGATMAFATLCIARLCHSCNCRAKESLFKIGVFTNRYIWGTVIAGGILLSCILFIEGLQPFFMVSDLTMKEFGIVSIAAFMPTLMIQGYRKVREIRSGR